MQNDKNIENYIWTKTDELKDIHEFLAELKAKLPSEEVQNLEIDSKIKKIKKIEKWDMTDQKKLKEFSEELSTLRIDLKQIISDKELEEMDETIKKFEWLDLTIKKFDLELDEYKLSILEWVDQRGEEKIGEKWWKATKISAGILGWLGILWLINKRRKKRKKRKEEKEKAETEKKDGWLKRWWKKLFGKEDKADDDTKKKKKWKFKKFLIWTGIIAWTWVAMNYGIKNPWKINTFFSSIWTFFGEIWKWIGSWFDGGKKKAERAEKAIALAEKDDELKYNKDDDVFVYREEEFKSEDIVDEDDPLKAIEYAKTKIDEDLDKKPSDTNPDDTIDKLEDDAEKLKKYSDIGEHINWFYQWLYNISLACDEDQVIHYQRLTSGGAFLLGSMDYEKVNNEKTPGLMVAQLDAMYSYKMYNFYRNDFFKKMLSMSNPDSVGNRIGGLKEEWTIFLIEIIKWVVPDVTSISFKDWIELTTVHDQLDSMISNNEEAIEYLQNAGKQFLKIQIYMQKLMDRFEFLLAQQKLAEYFPDERNAKNDTEREERTWQQIEDESFYEKYLKNAVYNNFLDKSMLDIFNSLELNYPTIFEQIKDNPLDKKTQKMLDKVKNEKTDYVNNLILYREDDLDNLEWTEKSKKNIEILAMMEKMYSSMEKISYETRYGMFGQIFGFKNNKQNKADLMLATGYDEYFKAHLDELKKIISDLKDNPNKVPTNAEMEKIIKGTDSFYDSITDLALGTNIMMELEEKEDTEWNKTLFAKIIILPLKWLNIAKQSWHIIGAKREDKKYWQAIGATIIGYHALDISTGWRLNWWAEKIFLRKIKGKTWKWIRKTFSWLSPSRTVKKFIRRQIKMRGGDRLKNRYANGSRKILDGAWLFSWSKEELFAKVGTGDISMKRAMEILEKNKINDINVQTTSKATFLLDARWKGVELAKINNVGEYMELYGDDILHNWLLVKADAPNLSTVDKVKKLPWEKVSFSLDHNAVESIHSFMKKYPRSAKNTNEKAFLEWLLAENKNVIWWEKTNMIMDDLIKNWNIDELKVFVMEMVENWKFSSMDDFKKIWWTVGKYINNFDDIDDFKKFLTVIYDNSATISKEWFFIENLAIKRKTIKSKFVQGWNIKNTEMAELHEVLPEETKFKDFKNRTEWEISKLKKQIPYSNKKTTLKTQLSNLKEMMEVDFRTFRALSFGPAEWMWKITDVGFSQIKEFSNLVNSWDGEFLKLLQNTKTSKEVKRIFSKKTRLNFNDIEIPDKFFENIWKMKSKEAIVDITKYVNEFESVDNFKKVSKWISKIARIAKSPWMKFIFRNLLRWLGGVGVMFWVIDVISTINDAKEISQTNIERWKNKMKEAYSSAGLYALGTSLMFVPGVWRVGWASIMVGTFVLDSAKKMYFETWDNALKNYADFQKYDSSLLVKEHIIWTLASNYHIDMWTSDLSTRWINILKDTSLITWIKENAKLDNANLNSVSYAMKWLLYIDEVKNHPFAWMLFLDRNDDELITELEKDPAIQNYLSITWKNWLHEFIGIVEDEIIQNTNKRYDYLLEKLNGEEKDETDVNTISLAVNYDLPKNPNNLNLSWFISENTIKNSNGLAMLDNLINESKYASIVWDNISDVKKYKKSLLADLQADDSRYWKLQKFFESADNSTTDQWVNTWTEYNSIDVNQLIYFFQKTAFEDALYEENDPQKKIIKENLEYFQKFMTYKNMIWEIDVNKPIVKNINSELWIDFVQIRKFLIDLQTIESTQIDDEYVEFIPEIQLELSACPMQNILYRISKEVIGDKFAMSENDAFRMNNTDEDLYNFFNKTHAKEYGIYFRPKDNALNINWDIDDTTFKDWKNPKNLFAIRNEVELQMTEMGGDAIDLWTGSEYLNKELRKKYLAIFDEEINYYENRKKNKKILLENLKTQSAWKRIYPSYKDQVLALKSGITDFGNYLYKWNASENQFERKYKNDYFDLKPEILWWTIFDFWVKKID